MSPLRRIFKRFWLMAMRSLYISIGGISCLVLVNRLSKGRVINLIKRLLMGNRTGGKTLIRARLWWKRKFWLLMLLIKEHWILNWKNSQEIDTIIWILELSNLLIIELVIFIIKFDFLFDFFCIFLIFLNVKFFF